MREKERVREKERKRETGERQKERERERNRRETERERERERVRELSPCWLPGKVREGKVATSSPPLPCCLSDSCSGSPEESRALERPPGLWALPVVGQRALGVTPEKQP